jgi:hypothetical protein
MDSHKWGPMLEDALMPKCYLVQTFLLVKEIGKRIPKVASSSTNLMTSIEELPAWKPGKIHIPYICHP